MKANTILDTIGNTPHVRVQRLFPGSEVWIKSERANPGGSIKDRIALAMIEAAEVSGDLQPGGTIIEPTSGNTGIGLAMVAAVKGYRLILTMPEDMSLERRRLLSRFGAELVLTPAIEGMSGAVYAAQTILEEHPDYFMPQQFENPANPEIHRRTTALEILEATDGKVDALVVGVGTGGSITGIGEVLKGKIEGLRVVAVEPHRSPVLSGGRARPHGIQGIGASFIPGVLNLAVIDEIVTVRDEDAYSTAKRLTREEGLLVGISAGANVFVSLEVAQRLGAGKTVVTILPDTGERYLSIEF
jgi:cysteine synthase A